MKRVHSVALVVIARNEAGRIERLLRGVAPWVDRMVVVDTGSTDATAALAAAEGAEVFHTEWIDDFAAARNVALAHANADWHIVLDADEWLVGGGAVLAGLRQTAPTFVGVLQLEDQVDGDSTGGVTSWLTRIIPGHLRFVGRIHEQVDHRMPSRRLAVKVGHDGYLADRRQAKQGRNRRLLKSALAENPNDRYSWYQLARDFAIYGDHAEAEAAYQRAATGGGPQHPWWSDLVIRRLATLKHLKRHTEAMDLADAQMVHCGEYPDFFFALGDVLVDLAADEPQHAKTLLPMIEAAWRRCLALGERPDLSGTVAGTGSHLAEENLRLVLELKARLEAAQLV